MFNRIFLPKGEKSINEYKNHIALKSIINYYKFEHKKELKTFKDVLDDIF